MMPVYTYQLIGLLLLKLNINLYALLLKYITLFLLSSIKVTSECFCWQKFKLKIAIKKK